MIKIEEKIEIKEKICLNCFSKHIKVNYQETDLEGQPDWIPVIYLHPYIECQEKKCGDIISAPEAEIIYHDAACVAQGRLRPKEITKLREKIQKLNRTFWGNSMDDFSLAFMLGKGQMQRWESGEYFINPHTNNNLIQLFENENYRKSFENKNAGFEIKLEEVFKKLSQSNKLEKINKIDEDELFA